MSEIICDFEVEGVLSPKKIPDLVEVKYSCYENYFIVTFILGNA